MRLRNNPEFRDEKKIKSVEAKKALTIDSQGRVSRAVPVPFKETSIK